MSKKCINCNNPKIYNDTTIRCEKCNNFLRKIDDTDIPSEKEQIKFNNENNEDPYSGYYNSQSDLNKDRKTDKRKQFKGNNEKSDINKAGWILKISKLKFPIKRNLEPIAQGVVRNFIEKEVRTFMITKVYRCLTQWVNYTPSNFMNSFQVYGGWGVNNEESERGQDIVFYGKVSKGNIANNNEAVIYGKRLRNGTIVARKVYNKTTDTYIKTNYSISPLIILAILFYIAYLIYKLYTHNWDLFVLKLKFAIVVILVIITILYFQIKSIKAAFGK